MRPIITSKAAELDRPEPGSTLRGEQLLLAEVKTGQYKGETLQVYGYVGPLYGVQLKEGDSATLLTVFLVCAYITVVTMVILGGVQRKTVCAALGTIAGTALSLLFGLATQSLARVDGLRLTDVEPLLQLRQTGTPIGLRGLLVGGIVISALGAVMDVAMSIASALTEVHAVAPERSAKELLRSGMNIGRDMVGTMTNTLILAFLGSGFAFIIYLYSLGLNPRQLISSAYLTIEVVSSISSSIGVILSVPLTAVISSVILTKGKT